MRIVVCNIGSTSFKFQLLDTATEERWARGQVQRVGSPQAQVSFWSRAGEVWEATRPVLNQREAVQLALDFLSGCGVIGSLGEIQGVGFKCVQAGEKNGSVLLTPDVLAAMEEYRDLAPAHNPPYLEAISMFHDRLPETPLVGVFEPGFHVDAPEVAKVYGVPWEWYAQYGVRRYGYHGASHRYVVQETVRLLGLPAGRRRVISCHLGGSSSLCACRDGVSVDTSMGFTPQSGLIQGTRIGDLDPYVLPYIMKRKGISLEQALEECSRQAGLAGISGTSGDMRDINRRILAGDRRARLAREKFIYDVKRYLGQYLVLLEGVDAVAFAGGIGQHDAELRAEVLVSLGFLGFRLDVEANRRHGPVVSRGDSAFAAVVVATDEEIVVARETARVIGAGR
jgi:acetate kinase